MGSEGMKP